MVETWKLENDENLIVENRFMDLSKAFDFKPEIVNYHYIAFISSFVL